MTAPALRPYQSTWIDGLRASFTAGFRAPLGVLPTGGGKTVAFSYLTSRLLANRKRVTLLAHRQELLDQISGTLDRFDVPHGRIAPGWLYDARKLAHVASVQTLVRRLERVAVPDYVICDEAHHAIGESTYGKVLRYWRERNPGLRIVGVTATPERLSGEGLGETFDDMVIGPTTRELIDLGALAPYRLISPPGHAADFDGVKLIAGERSRKGMAEVLRAKPSIVGDAVSHYAKLCNGAPAVAFCISVEEAELTAEKFRAAGFRSCSIDGKMDDALRRSITSDFAAGGINVLTSCEILSEGYDCPGIHAAIMLRPTESLALYLQQVGRALRPAPGKQSAIILDHVGNAGRIVAGEFQDKHGLPDAERQWSLTGRDGARKTKAAANACRQCEKCFAVSPAACAKCRECGAAFPVKAREVDQVEGELHEVSIDELRARARNDPTGADVITCLATNAARSGVRKDDAQAWALKFFQRDPRRARALASGEIPR